ncbi:NACHT domain-containing protein [Burkholderia gladioli]|uniref:NACHT domain-containing protein n=1 Tax=Burkholderia gladioli TaxID=28095 RepID=UPI001640F816|nr:NACHT domain-containing protein [Burkholderia gladioli]
MVTGIEGALIGAGSHFLKKPFEDFYSSCTNGIKSFAKTWMAAGAIDRLEQRIEELEKIRTIVSRQVSTLSEIYYPAHIINSRKQTIPVSSVESISTDKNILITGTAGQGKSVLMRYLAVQELRLGNRVPLFIELRRIDKMNGIVELLKQQLNLQSESTDDELLMHLLSRGNVTLLLDGFDEVPRELVLDVRDRLADLIAKHKKIKVVISSRPGALCAHVQDLPKIIQVEIAELGESDFEPFLIKIGTDPTVLGKLLQAVNSSSTQVKRLLKTPLMLTLLVLTCGGKQQIPDTLPEFYDSLFRVLAVMHDETKPGYVREMATKLTYAELEQLFECFSFVSREKFERPSLNPSQFEESIQIAIDYSGHGCTPEGFRTDVSETVCLMVREGVDTTFIHKSIHEYYTARFVKSLPDDETARQAYDSISEARLLSWGAELRFLEQIDPIRYKIFFRKQQIERFLEKCSHKPTNRKPITKAALKECLRYFWLLGPSAAGRLALSPSAMKGLPSQLLLEMGPDFSLVLRRNPVPKQAQHTTELAVVVMQNPILYEEFERIFSKKISNALEELQTIADEEKKRKATIFSILSKKPSLRKF